jgi:galactonate dehydratase
MYRSQYFEGGRVLTAAMSAVDIALHDVVAKHLKCPVYQLLGGAHRHHIPVYVTCQAAMGQEAVEEAKKLAAEGWPCIRFGGQNIYSSENVGDATVGYMRRTYNDDPLLFEPRESIAQTVEWMPKVREAVGNSVAIGIEYHHRLSVAEAANFIQKMPNGTLDWLEEPIRDESPVRTVPLRLLTTIRSLHGGADCLNRRWAVGRRKPTRCSAPSLRNLLHSAR